MVLLLIMRDLHFIFLTRLQSSRVAAAYNVCPLQPIDPTDCGHGLAPYVT